MRIDWPLFEERWWWVHVSFLGWSDVVFLVDVGCFWEVVGVGGCRLVVWFPLLFWFVVCCQGQESVLGWYRCLLYDGWCFLYALGFGLIFDVGFTPNEALAQVDSFLRRWVVFVVLSARV